MHDREYLLSMGCIFYQNNFLLRQCPHSLSNQKEVYCLQLVGCATVHCPCVTHLRSSSPEPKGLAPTTEGGRTSTDSSLWN